MLSNSSRPSTTPFEKLSALMSDAKAEKQKVPVIFDTDGGHDPDDFNVLVSKLLNDSHIDCKAIVTTGEFCDVKAKIIKAILRELGKNIPVYVGDGLQLKDITLSDGTHPMTIKEALSLSKEEQIEYLQKRYPTYPGDKFGGFYPLQGEAWKELQFEDCKADGDIEDAIELLNHLKNDSNVTVLATGELSNIARYYDAGLAEHLIVQHMGGWVGENNSTNESKIFPVGYLGRNLVADIAAAEKVFKNKNANIVLYMSHLKNQYQLQYMGDVRKLLCLVDQFPDVESLSESKLIPLSITLLSEASAKYDFKDCKDSEALVKFQEELKKANYGEKIKLIKNRYSDINDIKALIRQFVPISGGVVTLPHANRLGRAMSRDFANWLAQTAFPYIICSDPGTCVTAIHPEIVSSTQAVSIGVDAKAAISSGDRYLSSNFQGSVEVKDGGPISAITGLHNPLENIMKPIVGGLLAQMYPGVNYQEFMDIVNQDAALTEKSKRLNRLVSEKRYSSELKFSTFSSAPSSQSAANEAVTDAARYSL